MIKNTLIIALVIVIIYLYYQQRNQPKFLTGTATSDSSELTTFLKEQLNSTSLEELKTKLGAKTLNELLEENEDYETEVDTLTRSKNSLEQDLTAQSNAFQSRLREKDREIKQLKEDLGSEKAQLKGSLGRITKLTQRITKLEPQIKVYHQKITDLETQLLSLAHQKLKGKKEVQTLVKQLEIKYNNSLHEKETNWNKDKEQLETQLKQKEQTSQAQLKAINCLFDPLAKGYSRIDFNGLYSLLEKVAKPQNPVITQTTTIEAVEVVPNSELITNYSEVVNPSPVSKTVEFQEKTEEEK